MARLSLSYEQCAALRRAVDELPVQKRSRPLVEAIRILDAVLGAVERGRAILDAEEDPSSPAKSSS